MPLGNVSGFCGLGSTFSRDKEPELFWVSAGACFCIQTGAGKKLGTV